MDGQERLRDDDTESANGLILKRPTVAVSSDLLEAITRQLVGKLSTKLPANGVVGDTAPDPADHDLNEFCRALLGDTGDRAHRMFDTLRSQGTTPESLCLRYIAPAARRLGDLWSKDEVGFLEVTLGLARLHGMQRTMHTDFMPRGRTRAHGLKVLLSPVPGETHVLGLAMAADFFSRAGWIVDLNMSQDAGALVQMAADGHYDMIGLTAGCRAVMPDLQDIVPRLKGVKSHPKVVLGGVLAELEPNLQDQLGLDAILTDVTTAPFSCQEMLTAEVGH